MAVKRRRLFCTLLAGVAAVPSSAVAQAVAQQPTAPPTREEVLRDSDRRESSRPSRLSVERPNTPSEPCALATPELSNVRFKVTGVEFDGLREVRPADLAPAFAPYLNQEHPVSILCEIRDRAAGILDNKGYLAAVQIPPQEIGEGPVRLRVVMGRLAAIRVRGDAGRAERTIARYLDQLTQEEVFNTFAAERYLLLAGDLPGYDVRLALRPSPGTPGDLLGEVAVVRTSAEADFTLQNYGSEALGPVGGLVRAQLYGLTGLGDRTTISAFTTIDFHEQQTFQIGHDFRLGAEGLTLAGNFVYSWGRPDVGDANIDISARTLIANFEASYPFVRRQTATLRGSAGFDYIDQAVDLNELQLTRDRLRVAYARLDLQAFDPASNTYVGGYTPFEPLWRLRGTLEVRQGLDVLDASTDCRGNLAMCLAPGVVPPSRIEAAPTAALVRAQAYGEFRPHSKVAFSLGVRAQVANEPLLSFEEFSAGNFTVGRGYDPGTILGDSGLGFQAEFRVGSIVPRTRDDLALQPYIFADTAWVWNEDPSLTGTNPQELSSIGAGIRAGWGNRLRFDAAVAVPMERAGFQTERGDVRFLFNITTLLLPWSF